MKRERRRPAPAALDERDDGSELVYGLHPVLGAVERRRERVERLIIARDGGRGLGEALRQANRAGIPVSRLPREVLRRKLGRGAVHQGIAAQGDTAGVLEAYRSG